MPDNVKILPESIANQIAAGEVIQRPSSAVKELLENAIDAGSTEIKVVIKDAGKTLIQIIDNGCGMSKKDAQLCFDRHATSKIKKIDDLFSIKTMGFRGEALASIASIAQVELRTKEHDQELGREVHIAGSKISKDEACACSNGSTISIKNLFYNVPARRNFLKSNPVETKHIIEEFQRVAMANPDIHFELIHNGVQIYHLGVGNMRQRLVQILGKNYNERLIPIEEGTDIVKINGFIGKPDSAKKTRGEQFFFVNKRFIKSPYLHHAVMQAFENILPKGHYPFYCIMLEIDPDKIDINVHPTKQEIKFQDDKLLYTILSAVIKSSLGKFNITPSLDFEGSNDLDHFLAEPRPQPIGNSGYITRPSKMDQGSYKSNVNISGWEDLLEIQKEDIEINIEEDGSKSYSLSPDWDSNNIPNEEKSWMQIHNSYIISTIKSGFILINQQLAHERIKFEYYQNLIQNKKHNVQQLLFPLEIECPKADLPLLDSLSSDFNDLGFDLEHEVDNKFIIRGVPSDLMGKDDPRIIEELLEQYKTQVSELKLNKRDALAFSLSKYASIKLGKKLHDDEMQSLIDQLFACEQPHFSPDGKAIFVSISIEDIKNFFEQ